MLDKIDLSNSRTVTILVIVCMLIFACIYVMVNKQNNLEGFAESVLEFNDTVRLKDGLKSVILGTTGTNNANDYINSLIPAMSVIAYNGDAAPTGWQICDGKPLKHTNGDPVLTADGNSFINTPNLKGRTIIGVNPSIDATNGISVRRLSETGGAEQHILSLQEMPSHNHNMYDWTYTNGNTLGGGLRAGGGGINNGLSTNALQGENKPHNNMQPYYVLNYIIKQPIKP
jgi:microcystin-dependent protein